MNSQPSNNNATYTNSVKSVEIGTSFSNVRHGGNPSVYERLIAYSKHKGLKEQEVIRFAVSMLLDKVGF